MTRARPAGRYGIDAPWVPWLWLGLGVVYAVLAVCAAVLWDAWPIVTVLAAAAAAVFVAGAALYWHATLRGKFAVWGQVLDGLAPPSRVLDIGCGRGAVAIMTALRFPEARIEGIDLWRGIDQSGSSPDAAAANARENGVADRIRLTTGDMTALPFDDARFDLVTAGLAIHNVHPESGRRTAIDEAWRVLAPGGTLAIVDISKTAEYVARLRALGAADLSVRRAGWQAWWTGPWLGTRIVLARKPL